MDFGIWANKETMAPANTAAGDGQTTIDGQQTQSGDGPTSGNGSEASTPNLSTPVFSHQVEHAGVVCDNCETTIFGFRYKCCQCKDFDLCSTCERSGLHAGHVMLRIAFPEMANDAIRHHILKTPHHPKVRCGFGPTDESGTAIPLGFAGAVPVPPGFDYEHGRKRHCKRERQSGCHAAAAAAAGSSPDSSDETSFPWGPRCPVMLGKKEMKKWAKCMKKTAHLHKRSAQAYASQMGVGGAAALSQAGAGPRPEGEGAPQAQAAGQPAFDFSAAASQIQEFLNAFGVPIDVVELYDEWGNRGTPRPDAPQDAANTTAQQPQTAAAAAGTTDIAQQGALAEDMQRLNIGTTNGNVGAENGTAVPNTEPASATFAPMSGMEVDAGWTLLEHDRIEAALMQPRADNDNGPAAVSNVEGSQQNENATQIPIAFDSTPIAVTNVGNSNSIPPTPNVTGTATTRQPQSPRPIYPQLPPHLQQVMSGLSNTVNNVVRNIPIIPWNQPNGAGFVRPQQAGSTEVPSAPPNQTGQPGMMSDRMQMTLNQLLSMGFSNQDGWLARLVASKNGNLEEVLNSLFPVGSANTNTTS